MRFLVAANDSALGFLLQQGFGAESYAVDLTQNGEQAKSLVREHEYDLAILDLSLPKDEGLAVLQYLRLSRRQLPILIVIDLGADDFVLKPFSFSELSARVAVLLRRGSHYPGSMLRVEDLELNRLEHSVRRANRAIELTPKEFSLLEFLMGNSGQPLTRTQIIERVWNLSSNTWTNVVDVYINSLRKKVDATADRKLIHTIRGIGYQLDPGPAFRNYEVQQPTSVKGD